MEYSYISGVDKARKIREKYHLNDFPVDVKKICDSIGISVQYVDFEEIERRSGVEVSSVLTWKNGQYTILVNDCYSDASARFAIAHELGHYFIHAKDHPKDITASFRGDGSQKELTANKFAAELLMPEKLLEEEYGKMVIPVSDTLARKFKVPKDEMCKRLDHLEWRYI